MARDLGKAKDETAGPPWQFLLGFAVRVVTSVALFILIVIPAVLLQLIERWLTGQHLDGAITVGIKALSYLLFTIDFLLSSFFILRETYKTFRQIVSLQADAADVAADQFLDKSRLKSLAQQELESSTLAGGPRRE